MPVPSRGSNAINAQAKCNRIAAKRHLYRLSSQSLGVAVEKAFGRDRAAMARANGLAWVSRCKGSSFGANRF